MTLYEGLLFLHVTAAIVWVGGVVMHLALTQVSRRAGDPAERIRLLELDERLVLLYVVSALTVVGAGIGLVVEGGWEWGQAWVIAGLAVFAASFAIGLLFFGPQGTRLARSVERFGAASAEAQAVARRIEAVTWLELGLLLLAVFAMTVKPTF